MILAMLLSLAQSLFNCKSRFSKEFGNWSFEKDLWKNLAFLHGIGIEHCAVAWFCSLFWQHWLFLHQQSTGKKVTQNGMNNFISQCLCSAAKKFLKHKSVTSYYYLIWHLVRAQESIFLEKKIFTMCQLQHMSESLFNIRIKDGNSNFIYRYFFMGR